jgi:hypothetical protein
MRIIGLLDEEATKELEDIELAIRYGNNETENTQEDIPDQEFCF